MSSSSPSKNPKIPLAPLEIQTTASLGLQVPVGLVLLKLRTDIAQSVVVNAAKGVVTLSSDDATSDATSDMDASSNYDTTIAGISIYGYVVKKGFNRQLR